jgi:hypothetical protein
MTDTLTRAALALAGSQGQPIDSLDELEDEFRDQLIEDVKAVLGAIREPSDEQLIEAQRNMFGGTRSAPPSTAIAIGYRAMIDAALAEE